MAFCVIMVKSMMSIQMMCWRISFLSIIVIVMVTLMSVFRTCIWFHGFLILQLGNGFLPLRWTSWRRRGISMKMVRVRRRIRNFLLRTLTCEYPSSEYVDPILNFPHFLFMIGILLSRLVHPSMPSSFIGISLWDVLSHFQYDRACTVPQVKLLITSTKVILIG